MALTKDEIKELKAKRQAAIKDQTIVTK